VLQPNLNLFAFPNAPFFFAGWPFWGGELFFFFLPFFAPPTSYGVVFPWGMPQIWLKFPLSPFCLFEPPAPFYAPALFLHSWIILFSSLFKPLAGFLHATSCCLLFLLSRVTTVERPVVFPSLKSVFAIILLLYLGACFPSLRGARLLLFGGNPEGTGTRDDPKGPPPGGFFLPRQGSCSHPPQRFRAPAFFFLVFFFFLGSDSQFCGVFEPTLAPALLTWRSSPPSPRLSKFPGTWQDLPPQSSGPAPMLVGRPSLSL